MRGLGVSRTSKTPLHPQSNNTVELYVMTIEGHLSQMVSNWGEIPHNFLLAYRASTQETIGMNPAIMVLGCERSLPCGLLFASPSDMEQSRPENHPNWSSGRMTYTTSLTAN